MLNVAVMRAGSVTRDLPVPRSLHLTYVMRGGIAVNMVLVWCKCD